MPPNKNWADDHFKINPKPQGPPPARASRWGVLVVVAAFLVVIVGILADYTNTLPLGIVERLGLQPSPNTETAEPPHTETAEPPPARQAPASDAPASAPLFGEKELAPAADRSTAQFPEVSPEQTNQATTEKAPAIDERRASERKRSLSQAIGYLEKDLQKVSTDEAPLLFQVTIRRPAIAPFSAAERIQMADQYLASSRKWTATERLEINDERRRSVTQVNNANQRLKELGEKRQAIKARIEKAQAELEAIP